METSQQYPTVLEYHGYQVVATSPSPPRPFIIVPPARRRTRVVVRLVPQEVREGVEDALLQPVAAKLARLPFVIALIPLLAIANVARRHLQNVGQKQPQNQHIAASTQDYQWWYVAAAAAAAAMTALRLLNGGCRGGGGRLCAIVAGHHYPQVHRELHRYPIFHTICSIFILYTY